MMDSEGEVYNCEETYTYIAESLKNRGRVMIGWTDGLFSHFDILFVVDCDFRGLIQGGIKPKNDLTVAVMRVGAFAFEINRKTLSENYVEEKFGRYFGGSTKTKVAELISKVKAELLK